MGTIAVKEDVCPDRPPGAGGSAWGPEEREQKPGGASGGAAGRRGKVQGSSLGLRVLGARQAILFGTSPDRRASAA